MAGLVVLAAAGWSIFWSFAADRVAIFIEDRIDVAGAHGLAVTCPGRNINGWPFRMEIRCDDLDLSSAGGVRVATGSLRAVALAYDPRHVIIEADGPLDVRARSSALELSAVWSAARASMRTRGERLAASALSLQDMTMSLSGLFGLAGHDGSQRIAADNTEFHLRQSPVSTEAADVALTVDGLSLQGLFQGEEPLDVAILLHVANAADLLSGNADVFIADMIGNARAFDVSEARLSLGDTRLTANGSLKLDASGYLSGELDVTVVEPENLARLLTPLYPQGSTMPTAFQGVLIGFGSSMRVEGRPAVKAKLRIAAGQVRIGLVPVAQIPPIFQ